MKVTDIALTIAPNAKLPIIGIRPGEKIHEQMIGVEDAPHTFAYEEYFKILPAINSWSSDPVRIGDGLKVPDNFSYTSDQNTEWMDKAMLRVWLVANSDKIGVI